MQREWERKRRDDKIYKDKEKEGEQSHPSQSGITGDPLIKTKYRRAFNQKKKMREEQMVMGKKVIYRHDNGTIQLHQGSVSFQLLSDWARVDVSVCAEPIDWASHAPCLSQGSFTVKVATSSRRKVFCVTEVSPCYYNLQNGGQTLSP